MNETIQVLREQAEIVIGNKPGTGFKPASPKQAQLIAAEMERVLGSDRERRIQVLREIFPWGVRPVQSTCHLSVAEASVLIEFLYGLDSGADLPAELHLSAEAENLLTGLKSSLSTQKRQALIDAGQLEMEMR